MKQLRINVAISENEIMIQTMKDGFEDTTSSILEIIGVLEDVKNDYVQRLKTKARATKTE